MNNRYVLYTMDGKCEEFNGVLLKNTATHFIYENPKTSKIVLVKKDKINIMFCNDRRVKI